MRKLSKKLSTFILIFCTFFTAIPINETTAMATTSWDGSSKTEVDEVDGTYHITSVEELYWLSDKIRNGEQFNNKNIDISGFLDFNNHLWNPIEGTILGTINIHDCTIIGLNVYADGGLFGEVTTSNININNVIVDDATISKASGSGIGIIAGTLNLTDRGSINISNLNLNGNIECNRGLDGGSIAGIVGVLNFANEGHFELDESCVDIKISSGGYLSEYTDAGIAGCINDMNGNSSVQVLKTFIKADITNSSPAGYTTSKSGGLFGQIDGVDISLIECGIKGKIYDCGYHAYTSGFIAQSDLESLIMQDCYSTCTVKSDECGGYALSAGIIASGKCINISCSSIKNCYLAGNISANPCCVDGWQAAFFTNGFSSYLPMDDCVYDVDSTGINNTHMWGNNVLNGCKAVNLSDMSDYSTFNTWDFENVWFMGTQRPNLLHLPYDGDEFPNNEETLSQYLNSMYNDSKNVTDMKYLANDNNFTNSAFVYENDSTFSSQIAMAATDLFFRGWEGRKDLFDASTSVNQAEEILAALLYKYQDECCAVSYIKTAKEFSKVLKEGFEDYIQANEVQIVKNEEMSHYNDEFNEKTLIKAFNDKNYDNLMEYMITDQGYSEDDIFVKTISAYLSSQNFVDAYNDNFKYISKGLSAYDLTNNSLKKLFDLEALYSTNQLYSDMLLYIENNCKYSVVCDAAKELLNVINGCTTDQIKYISQAIVNKAEDFALDKIIDIAISHMGYAFLIKNMANLVSDVANFTFKIGSIQEQRDKMRIIAFLGNSLSMWMTNSYYEYMNASDMEQKTDIGIQAYYAAYMLWQTRKAGEEALQGYIETHWFKNIERGHLKKTKLVSMAISDILVSMKTSLFSKQNKNKLLTLVIACPVDVEIKDLVEGDSIKVNDGLEAEYSSENIDYSVAYDTSDDEFIKMINFGTKDYQVKCTSSNLGDVDIIRLQINDDGSMDISYIDDIEVDKNSLIEISSLSSRGKVLEQTGEKTIEYSYTNSSDTYIPVEQIMFSKHSITLDEGETTFLKKEIKPFNASNKMLYWYSDNSKIANVSQDGLIKGISQGTATIYAMSSDGKNIDKCVVNVKTTDSKFNQASDTTGGNSSGSSSDSTGGSTSSSTGGTSGSNDSDAGNNSESSSGTDSGNSSDADTGNGNGTDISTDTGSDEDVIVKTGAQIEDAKTKATYKVLSKTKVAYVKPSNMKSKSVTVPATITYNGVKYKVTEIAADAFKNDKKLEKITIGKNIVKIHKNAFYGCTKLKKVVFKTSTLKYVAKTAFRKCSNLRIVSLLKKNYAKQKNIVKAALAVCGLKKYKISKVKN